MKLDTTNFKVPHDVVAIVRGMAQKGHELSGVSVEKLIEDRFYWPKYDDHLKTLERYSGLLNGKTILEIGCGVGSFLLFVAKNRGILRGCGIEKSDKAASYTGAAMGGKLLLEANHVTNVDIVEGIGEQIPLRAESMDTVYSSNAFEHMPDPEAALHEAWRVLKTGGVLQIVVPNYFSFWEGHYGLLWMPFLNKTTGKYYVKMFGRDPSYIDTLSFVTPALFKKWLKKNPRAKLLTTGKEIFKERMRSFSPSYAKLGKLSGLLSFARALKIHALCAAWLCALEMHTPVVFTVKKEASPK